MLQVQCVPAASRMETCADRSSPNSCPVVVTHSVIDMVVSCAFVKWKQNLIHQIYEQRSTVDQETSKHGKEV